MAQYAIKRIMLLIPVLFIISLISFTLIRVVPGDVVDVMYADSALSQKDIDLIKHQLGMDKPTYVQYISWLGGVLKLNAGNSLWSRRPVFQELSDRLPVTVELAVLAFILTLIVSIPLGVLAATHQDTFLDNGTRFFAILLHSAPDFWIATIAITFLASWFGWIPPLGHVASFWTDPFTNFQQFFLPAIILGLGAAASQTRYVRNTLLEVMRQDYIRTAFAKGLTGKRVWYLHAIKNAMIPVITAAGGHLGRLLGGTVIIENIFGLPGIGQLTLASIQHRDIPQLQLNVLFLAAVFVIVNLVVDLSYGWLDPRIRFS
jgi:peptide/nickel transport system permease protein